MLFTRFLTLLSILLICIGDAHASDAPLAHDADQVKQLQDLLVQAYIHRDVAALDRILADDYTFVTDRGNLTTKQQVLGSFGAGGDRTIASYEIADATVRVYGDAAVMVYRYVSRETYKGHDDSGNYRVTRVFARLGGRWRIVAGQETRIVL
jgi:ketosteroid isomerase-like protein